MKEVIINTDFRDRYTGKKHIAGKTEKMTDERVKEIKEINSELVTVIGDIPEENKDNGNKEGNENKEGNK